MGNLIVKDNVLIQASHKLTEIEQRLVLLAILKIREKFDNVEQAQNQEITIHANDYTSVFGVGQNAGYQALRKAVVGLYRAEWGYKYINARGNVAVRYERFTQSAEYVEKEAVVKLMFSTAIIPHLVALERRFTSYAIEQIANLDSGYALHLFEVLMIYFDDKKGSGWLEISLDELRFTFGLLAHQYSLMSNFKKFVLDFSIQQINENTDYTVTYQQRKQGRKIVGFRFDTVCKIKPKKNDNQRDTNTVDMFDNLTDKEREIVAQKNSYADSINATEQHRKNLINKAIKDNRASEAEAQERKQERKQKQAQAQAQAQNELEYALSVYQQLIDADDDVIKKFIDDNKKMLGGFGAEKMFYDRAEYRSALQMMRHRFENLISFRALDLSVLK